jgi:hypothetical protein
MANEFVLTPAAWLQPASLFTPTPKAAQRVLTHKEYDNRSNWDRRFGTT